ncbi:MAG: sugar phosphate nucleotidyltransferase [Acidimicrobiales bacterium]
MTSGVAGVVLAAGAGTRLRPLTLLRPKALCPVDDVPLVDLAIDRVCTAVGDVAVNVHHGRDQLEAHLQRRVHLSFEEDRALGTAGALGHLRSWLDGRGALVVNADAWCPGSLLAFVQGWDGERMRLLLAGDDALTPSSRIAAALMPWPAIARLPAEPAGLYEASWRDAHADGRLDVVRHDGPFVDCGTAAQYLEANLTASGGESVVGEGASVAGVLDRCVVWPGAVVWPGESLTRAIRAGESTTVLVR